MVNHCVLQPKTVTNIPVIKQAGFIVHGSERENTVRLGAGVRNY